MSVLTPACGPTAPVVAGKDARAAVGQQTVAPGKGTLHSFTLHNTSGVASTQTIARLGLAFLKGDVPAGKRIAVRQRGGPQIAFAAAAATNTWADGSLRSTADGGLVMFDGVPLPAGGSRSYEVFVRNGDIATSGFDPFAWLAAHGNDLTVAVTARTGSATGPRPDLLFSLKTAIATTTRREILCDTRRFVRIKAWQKVPQEEHLICEYHLDFWLDGNGQPWGLEFAPVLTQHWWVADPFGTPQTKERQTYDALVRNGTTVLDTRSRLDHAYYCRWASLRPQDDAQHARKHWIGLGLSQMPTVRVQYDDECLKRMMKAGYIPPLSLGVNYLTNDGYPTTNAPLGTNGHRAAISASGAYPGRGIWGNPDAKLVSLQSSAAAATAEVAWRKSRVMAQAGLSVYAHIRDHRTVGSDTSNKLMPMPLRQVTSGTQSYVGLASPLVYSFGRLESTGPYSTIIHGMPVGGTGSFNSYDGGHAVNYSGPIAFLECKAYLADAAVSQYNRQCTIANFNALGNDTYLMYYTDVARRTAQSMPAMKYGQIPSIAGQERGFAWAINMLNHAYMVRSDSHPEQPFLKNSVLAVDKWLSDSYGYLPTAHRDKGMAYSQDLSAHWVSLWMVNWQGMAAYGATRLYDFLADSARGLTGFEEAAYLSARYIISPIANSPYSASAYRILFATTAGGANLVPSDEWPVAYSSTFSSNTGTASPSFGLPWQNGDKVRFGPKNQAYTIQAAPNGVDFATLYYMVNVSGNTFQLATSHGGTPIAIGNATVDIFVTPQVHATASLDPSGTRYWPPDDDYLPITFALFEEAVGMGHADVSGEIRDRGRGWFTPKATSFSTYAPWNYDGANLQ